MRRLRTNLSSANAAALLALFISLGGGAQVVRAALVARTR
jgi:hypothetical protein